MVPVPARLWRGESTLLLGNDVGVSVLIDLSNYVKPELLLQLRILKEHLGITSFKKI